MSRRATEMINMLRKEKEIMHWGSFQLYQTLVGFHREFGYAESNVSDLTTQLNTAKEGNTNDRNQMEIVFKALSDKIAKMLSKSHSDGQ